MLYGMGPKKLFDLFLIYYSVEQVLVHSIFLQQKYKKVLSISFFLDARKLLTCSAFYPMPINVPFYLTCIHITEMQSCHTLKNFFFFLWCFRIKCS